MKALLLLAGLQSLLFVAWGFPDGQKFCSLRAGHGRTLPQGGRYRNYYPSLHVDARCYTPGDREPIPVSLEKSPSVRRGFQGFVIFATKSKISIKKKVNRRDRAGRLQPASRDSRNIKKRRTCGPFSLTHKRASELQSVAGLWYPPNKDMGTVHFSAMAAVGYRGPNFYDIHATLPVCDESGNPVMDEDAGGESDTESGTDIWGEGGTNGGEGGEGDKSSGSTGGKSAGSSSEEE